MTRDPEGAPVRDWQLERFRLGELPDGEAQRVRRALERGEGLRRRMADLERSDAEILSRHSPAAVAGAVRARLAATRAERRSRRRGGWTLLAVAAGLASVASAAALLALRQAPRPSGDATWIKGLAPQLLLYRQTTASAAPERLLPGSLARDRDLVQVAYQAAGRSYGVIVSVDGRGLVTRHLPVSGSQAARLEAGAPVPLPDAYQLDDAPGFEMFYLVTADEPFSVEGVVDAVRRRHAGAGAGAIGRGLGLPASMDQFSFVLEKEPAR